MAVSEERYFRMAKKATFYNRTTGLPIEGCLFKINDCKIEDKTERDPFRMGGEIVADAVKERTFTLTFTAASYNHEVYEQLANATVTETALNAAGQVIGLANVGGTTSYSAASGVASIAVASGSELKEGHYKGYASASATIQIYGFSDQSFNDGNNIQFEDDTYAIGDAFTLPSASAVTLTELGVSFTGGSAVNMNPGDTFEFTILRQNSAFESILVTGETDYDEVGVMLFPDKYNDEYAWIDVFKILPAGLPLEIKDSWSTYTVTVDMMKDEAKGGYYKVERGKVG
ncbi:MAG: hypothetical protein WC455_20510 [Dehalococcoidia bacterium]